MVVRAFAIEKNKAGETTTHTFLIGESSKLPIVSIAIAPHQLFHPTHGLFLKGPNANKQFPFYKANFWSRREIPIHFELFDGKKGVIVSGQKGLSIFGGMSRIFPQKSLAIVGRKRYGNKYIKHRLFENRHYSKYKHLVLRNGGTDFNSTHLRDAVLTTLGEKSGLPVQAYRPCLLFINGEYWGIYDMREKMNRYFVENNLGVDKDSIDLIEHRQDVKFGSISHYNKMRQLLWKSNLNLAEDKNYKLISSMMDVDNFLNYQAFQIYIDNQDAGGNIKFWRPKGKTGKWSWLLYDTDYGFGMNEKDAYNNNSLAFHTEPNGPAWPNPDWSTLNLRKLLENKGFKLKFINRFADMMNSHFAPEAVIQTIDSLRSIVADDMPRHLKRFGYTPKQWEAQIERLRVFARERPQYMRKFLDERWKVGAPVFVTVLVEGEGTVYLNDFLGVGDSLHGQYFSNVPITLNAFPKIGYQFSHWEGLEDLHSPYQKLPLAEGDRLVKAIFKKIENPLISQLVITELGFNQPGGKWLELHNSTNHDVKLKGWYFTTRNDTIEIPEIIIKAREILVFCEDTAKLRKAFPEKPFEMVELPLPMNNMRDFVRLHSMDGTLIDELFFVHEQEKKPYVMVRKIDNMGYETVEGAGAPGEIPQNEVQNGDLSIKGLSIFILLLLGALMGGYQYLKQS